MMAESGLKSVRNMSERKITAMNQSSNKHETIKLTIIKV